MMMLGLNETIDQLAIGNSVHWHSYVQRENSHVLRALYLEVEGQRKQRRLKRT